MTNSLIRGRYVICRATSKDKIELIENGGVFQQDGVVTAIGNAEELIRQHRPERIFGTPNHVVLPGFINAHHHGGLLAFQMGTKDMPLERWSVDRLRRRDVNVYLDTLYAAFEMVESGITTVQHLHSRGRGALNQVHAAASDVIRAYRDIGMRVSYSFGLRDQNRMVYESDEKFLKLLPQELAKEVEDKVLSHNISVEETLELFTSLHAETRQEEGVGIQLAASNLQWCSDRSLKMLQTAAEMHDVPVHMHLLETRYQKEYARRRTGGSAVRHLHALGMLGPRLTLGHGVWLTESDIELIAQTGTLLCHCPSSNLRLSSGIAPIACAIHAGVQVALGLDDASLNDDRSILQEMRLALRLHRAPEMQVPPLSASDVFRMATESAALTTPFGTKIGAIEVGRAADLVLMDWTHISQPYLDADVPIIDALVLRARTTGVDTVLIDGIPVMLDRQFTRLNKSDAIAELAASLRLPLSAEEVQRKAIADDVAPYVERFYRDAGYAGTGSVGSYYGFNSRK